jgi:hypothetical protein
MLKQAASDLGLKGGEENAFRTLLPVLGLLRPYSPHEYIARASVDLVLVPVAV